MAQHKPSIRLVLFPIKVPQIPCKDGPGIKFPIGKYGLSPRKINLFLKKKKRWKYGILNLFVKCTSSLILVVAKCMC